MVSLRMSVTGLAGIALMAAVGLAGCATYEPYPVCDFRELQNPDESQVLAGPALIGPQPGALRPMPLNTVNVLDRSILRKVMVQQASAGRATNGSVEIAARLVNCTDHPLQVEGRTHFLTASNMDAEPPSAWQRVQLPPRSMGVYASRSTATDQVQSYLVEVREGR